MPTKAPLSPRKLMEMAIEVMRRTVSEPRKNGKASPLVGAVLYKPDSTIETARSAKQLKEITLSPFENTLAAAAVSRDCPYRDTPGMRPI